MNESLKQAIKVLRLLWNKRWLVWSVTAVICVVSWVGVYLMPNQYQSMARVFINTDTMLTPLLRGLAVDSNTRERLAETTRRTLLSRPNLEKVVRETDMDLDVDSPEEMEGLLASLGARVSVEGGKRNNIYVISYTDKNPVLAKKVVDAFLSIFVESTLGVARSDNSVTERFIEEQIKEYEARLIAAENKLKKFKQSNMGLMPSDAGGYFTRLQAERDRLEQARLELNESIQQRDELKRQVRGEALDSHRLAAVAEQANEYDERIKGMEVRLDDLLLQFTELHPDVISLKNSIEALEQQKEDKAAEQEFLADSGSVVDAGVSSVVVSPELRAALGTVEAKVSALQVRVSEYEKRTAKLEDMVDTIPEVEAEFARLNRDYSVNRNNYEELVNRRESAKISRDADQSVDNMQFQIVDPPVEALVPGGPNRTFLYTLALFGGVGIAGFVAWYLGQIRPAFYDQRELRDYSGLPVYGGVALIMTTGQLVKQRFDGMSFALACAVLLIVYGALVALQVMNVT